MSNDLQIPLLTPGQAKETLNAFIEDIGRAGTQGVFLWGPPGIGKSAIVKQIAEERGLSFIDLRLNQLDPVDIRGLPNFDHENKKAVFYPPNFLPKEGDKDGILFLDEINTASQATQASAYQLILDRRVGDYELPNNWTVIAAGNRRGDGAISGKLSSALSNRFMHFEITSDVDEWIAWAYKNDQDPFVIGFIRFQGDALFQFRPDLGELAFPTPRSWAFVSNLRKVRDVDLELYNRSLQATIGKAAASQFFAFLKYKDTMPDPKAILAGEEYTIPEAMDGKFVLMSALIDELFRSNTTDFDDALTNFMQYASKYDDSEFSDHGVVIVRELLSAASGKQLPGKESSSKSPLKAKSSGTYVNKIIKNKAFKDWQKANGSKLK